jgi:mRNA interferase YafQ
MRRIIQQTKFRREYKKQKSRGKNIDKLDTIVWQLVSVGKLGPLFQPHKLSGEYAGFWECHIEPDWLLIYDVTEKEVLLARTGTHADLFE